MSDIDTLYNIKTYSDSCEAIFSPFSIASLPTSVHDAYMAYKQLVFLHNITLFMVLNIRMATCMELVRASWTASTSGRLVHSDQWD